MEDFKAFVPLTDLDVCKSGEGDNEEMIVSGVASTNSVDADEEILEPTGLDVQEFLDKGQINWEHDRENPSSYIGYPVDAKITKIDGRDALFTKIKLYKGSKKAEEVFELAHILKSNSSKRRVGISIEGRAIERDPQNPKRITKAKITGAALTMSPKNKDTFIEIVKGEDFYKYDIIKSEGNKNYILEEVDLVKGEGVRLDDSMNIEFFKQKKEEIQKSLTEKDILYHVFSKFKSEGKYGDILKSQKSIDTYFSIVKKIESIKKNNNPTMTNEEVLTKADALIDQISKGDFSSFTKKEEKTQEQIDLEKAEVEKEKLEKAKKTEEDALSKAFAEKTEELTKALSTLATTLKEVKGENEDLKKSLEDLNKRPSQPKGFITREFIEKGQVSEDGLTKTLNPSIPAHRKIIKGALIKERNALYKTDEERYGDNEIQKAIEVGEACQWSVISDEALDILKAKGINVSEDIIG